MASGGRLSDRKFRRELQKLNLNYARGLRLLAPQIPMQRAVEVAYEYINTFLVTRDFEASMKLVDSELPQIERQRVVWLYQQAEDLHFRHTGEHVEVPSGDPFKMDDI